ncbi:MAG: glycoside hydrolase family 3 N-terminal domain-containing protein, partial [Lachnospiraceae bacterium]|nr:glycoside hydrolase family 3 N-terminal domain-containing protein [Lachnospiraceae bacterium]
MNRNEARSRAEELVSQMKLEEKVTQIRYNAPAIDRLGIPAYNWWNEALHGVARAGTATSFPQAIGMAATFDEALLHDIADAIAIEGRAKYNAYSEYEDRDIYKGLTFWSPNVNIFRDPRWGRGQETYGEDPYLSGTLGTAFVKGMQGDGEYLKAAACAKHFAAHSGPEAVRHQFNAEVSQKDLYETYLPAFEALVKEAGVEAVMGAYNRTNGEPCCGSPTLIQKILRDEWKFEGHYVSDCWAVRDFHEHHKVTKTPAESAAMAMNAGCDLNCGNAFLAMWDACKAGMVSEERITEAVVRLYTTRFLLGLFDETEYDEIPYEMVECPKHLKLSEKAARESMVLLKNNGLLPLKKEAIGTIGVIGPNANSREALIGNYHGTSSEYITVLEGIQRYVGEDVRVLYSEGCSMKDSRVEHLAIDNDRLSEAMIVAEHSDVVVLVVGLNETLEGEEGDEGNNYASGDKDSLLLPKPQRELMKAVAEMGKTVVLALMAGSDMDLSYADEQFDAVMLLWYPGARGGKAFAELLFGDASPSGKLCVTFYDGIEALPDFEDYSMKGRTYRYLEQNPEYPFGYGLTYGDAECT